MAAFLSVCCALASVLAIAAQDAPTPPAPELLDHAALSARMGAIAGAHPECAALVPVGFSRARRRIDALRFSAGEPAVAQPAILVVANIDGPQAFSSAVALTHAQALADGFANDKLVQDFLAKTTVYIVPRANPDAAEARFAMPRFELEATGTGVDNDRDRRDGEDPPSDVDGDGVVAWMRWKDPEGQWILDPKDPRAMLKADPKKGQRGEYMLALEGRDLDRDETPSEDGTNDAILNQNFPQDWQEHGAAAGRFPMDEPEARALAEFMLQHKEIAMVVTYGALDTLVEKPKSVADGAAAQKRIPAAGWLESDAALLAELSKRYGELTTNKTKGRGSDSGSFQAWVYQHRGLWSLAIPLFDIPTEAKKKEPASGDKTAEDNPAGGDAAKQDDAPKARGKSEKKDEAKPSEDLARLEWIDASNEAARFVPWKSFAHPELGAVEIGGFAPFARTEPPTADWPKIAKRELDFLLTLGADLPRVSIEEFSAKRLSPGLIEVKAAIYNGALLPLASKSGQRTESSRPLKCVLVLPEGASIASGSKQTLIRDLGGKSRREMHWLVVCDQPTQIGLKLDSDNAGAATAMVEVK